MFYKVPRAFNIEKFEDGDVVVTNTKTGDVNILNSTAALILDLILTTNEKKAFELFLQRLSIDDSDKKKYLQKIENDFKETINLLINNGIIVDK